MEKITSFTIDHIRLKPGIYVSRKDPAGSETVTTFDIRMTSPNDEPVMNTAEVHTIEHLGATFLRNHPVYKDRVLYFGPMGCRTGFYLLLVGDYTSEDILPLIREMYEFIRDFRGDRGNDYKIRMKELPENIDDISVVELQNGVGIQMLLREGRFRVYPMEEECLYQMWEKYRRVK